MSSLSAGRWLTPLATTCFLFLLSQLGFAQNVINSDGSALNVSTPLTINGDLTNSFSSTVTVQGSSTSSSLIPTLVVTGNLSSSFGSTVTVNGLVSGIGLVAPVTIQVDGNLTNDGTSTVQIQNHSLLSVGGDVINSGQFLTGNTSGDVGFNGVVIGGSFTNNPGAMLILNAAGDTLYANALINAGDISVGNGAVVSISGAVTETAGMVDVQLGGSIEPLQYLVNGGALQIDGALSASSVTVGSGDLYGTGSIAAPITNNTGIVEPGAPGAPGVLTVTGDFTQNAEGTFIEQISPGGGYGQLQDIGSVGLNGTLEIVLVDGWVPPIGSEYFFIDSSSAVNTPFENVIGLAIDDCEGFAVIYDPPDHPDSVELSVEATGSDTCSLAGAGGPGGQGAGGSGGQGAGIETAPEPSSFVLLAGVALAMAGYARRRLRRVRL
jgi:hypothetical protein